VRGSHPTIDETTIFFHYDDRGKSLECQAEVSPEATFWIIAPECDTDRAKIGLIPGSWAPSKLEPDNPPKKEDLCDI
jgi:hypothetical protein